MRSDYMVQARRANIILVFHHIPEQAPSGANRGGGTWTMAITSKFEGSAGPKPLFRACRLLAAAAVLVAAMAASSDTRANGVAHSAYSQQTVVAAALKTTVPPELALAVARVGGVRWSDAEDGHVAVGIMGVRPPLARAEFGSRDLSVAMRDAPMRRWASPCWSVSTGGMVSDGISHCLTIAAVRSGGAAARRSYTCIPSTTWQTSWSGGGAIRMTRHSRH